MQSTLAPVPARLGVIPAMGAARASPWEWRGSVGSDKGQECPCVPVLSVPLALVEPDLSRLVQLPGCRSWGTTSVLCSPSLQQGLAFLWGQPKDIAAFWAISPQQVLLPVAELCRGLGGLCEEEEERVRGKENLLTDTSAPSRDKVLGLASASQLSLDSTQLFHVCLQITTVSFFLFFFFQCKVANQQSYFGAELLPGGALSVTAGGHVAVPAPAPAGLGWQGEHRNPGNIKNKWFSWFQSVLPCGVSHSHPKAELCRSCWVKLTGAAVLVSTWPCV